MHLRSGLSARGLRTAFTLVEVLLTTALLFLLLGAVIFSFSKMREGTAWLEGVSQFETMLRLARAHAAETGRKIQVIFESDEDDPFAPPLFHVALAWEADPLGNPGVFEPLTRESWSLASMNELVGVAELRTPEELATQSQMSGRDESIPEDIAEWFGLDSLEPLTFYPDGTCDSAEIVLVSRSEEQIRRIKLILGGITGSVRRQEFRTADEETESESNDTNVVREVDTESAFPDDFF